MWNVEQGTHGGSSVVQCRFGDNSCDPSSVGDLVADTPQHISKASTVNCHSNPNSWNTCPSLPGTDPIRNYMSKCSSKFATSRGWEYELTECLKYYWVFITAYSSDNLCRTQFTPGQVDRMVAQYEIYRKPSKDQARPAPAPRPVPSKSPTSPPVLYIVAVDPPGPDCVGYFKRCKTSQDCCAGTCVNYLRGITPGICWWQY